MSLTHTEALYSIQSHYNCSCVDLVFYFDQIEELVQTHKKQSRQNRENRKLIVCSRVSLKLLYVGLKSLCSDFVVFIFDSVFVT